MHEIVSNSKVQTNHEILDDQGERIAYARVIEEYYEDTDLLDALKVEPDYRRQGLARKLLEHVIATHGHKEILLRVCPFADKPVDKATLQKFYESYGFEVYHTTDADDPEDALNDMVLRTKKDEAETEVEDDSGTEQS